MNTDCKHNKDEFNEAKPIEKVPTFTCMAMNKSPVSTKRSFDESLSSLTILNKHSDCEYENRDGSPKKQKVERWIVPNAQPIPTYPLEPMAFHVNEDVQIVATRIDRCLKARSIEVNFDSCKARAICTTDDFMKYYVTLYDASSGVNGKKGTVVEVQRRKGCGMRFAEERRAVTNAAKGNEDSTQKEKQSFQLCIPPSMVESEVLAPPSDDYLTVILEGVVENAHSRSNRDGLLMSLDHLACMTNPMKASPQFSLRVARMILANDAGIRDLIGTILSSTHQDEVSVKTRHSGLAVMSNSLDVLSNSSSVEEWTDGSNEWFVHSLLPSLTIDIGRCKCLHNAFLSVKCLWLLVKTCPDVRMKAKSDCELMDHLENAVTMGERNHLKLEEEARLAVHALVCH